MVELLQKMGLNTKKIDESKISVEVPITRSGILFIIMNTYYFSDILHPCDIAEDVAIAYGYNNVEEQLPPTPTLGGQLALNKVSDLIRQEMAQAGYKEILNFALCSIAEISNLLLRDLDPRMVKIGIMDIYLFGLIFI